MSVMPDTGFVPTIAIAFAATVVNRKAITPTSNKPMAAWNQLLKYAELEEQEGDDQLQDIISRFLFFLKNRPDTTICRELQPKIPVRPVSISTCW